MNSKNGFFGLVPPSSGQKDAPTPAPAPASLPEEAWPLVHNLPLDAEGGQKQLSEDEKKAAWRVTEGAPSLQDDPHQAVAPGKGEQLADGLRQTRRSQRSKAKSLAASTAVEREPRPATVSAEMSWPDQDIRVPIQGDAQVPVPPTVAPPRAVAPAAETAGVDGVVEPIATAADELQPRPPEASPQPVAAAAPPDDAEDAADHVETPPAQAQPMAAATPQAEAPSTPADENTALRRFFTRLSNEAGAGRAAEADPLDQVATAPVRSGFLSGLGKK